MSEPSHRWVASLLQLSDTFYPTGGYAHSFGLEGLVQDGFVTDRASLRAFLLEQALPALARTDLVVAAAAWDAAGPPADLELLKELCRVGSALRGAREPRDASNAIGRQRLELLANRPNIPPLVLALRQAAAAEAEGGNAAQPIPTPGSVIAAVEARVIQAPVEAALAALIYGAAAAILAAAVKLLRLGQNAVQALLTEALALAPSLIAQSLAISLADAGSFNPWWDMASARHERADFRLFIS